MNIYQPSGYLDMRKIMAVDVPFIFVVGARGTGKTYGGLQTLVEDKTKFIFMRRTQTQLDEVKNPDFSPFKSLNRDMGWDIDTKNVSKHNIGFYHCKMVDGEPKAQGVPIGYGVALSTLANVRGFDASDVEVLFYDEFMPEKHERPIKEEGAAFLNAQETINRNRELKGKKPLKVVAASNSNDLANPIFMELGIVRLAERMKRKKQEVFIDRERGLMLIVLDKSPISERKKDTALYRLTGLKSRFARMSIGNEFSSDDMGRMNSRPLVEYRPIVTYGEITLYEHKARHELYVSTHRTGSPPTFGTGDADRARFRRQYMWIWEEYMDNNIEFEEYLCEIILTKIYS